LEALRSNLSFRDLAFKPVALSNILNGIGCEVPKSRNPATANNFRFPRGACADIISALGERIDFGNCPRGGIGRRARFRFPFLAVSPARFSLLYKFKRHCHCWLKSVFDIFQR